MATLLLTALAASGASASTARRAAEPETAAQCAAKLRRLVADVASLDKLADDVKAGSEYLLRFDNRFFPIEKGRAETLLMIEDLPLAGTNSSNDPRRIERALVQTTAQTLRKLENYIEYGHELVQAREKKCDALKAAGSGTTTTSSGAMLKIELGTASETINLATAVRMPPPGSPGATVHLKSGSSYTVTVTLDGSLPAGKTVYVIYHGVILEDIGPDPSGATVSIQEAAGFGAGNDVEAVACDKGGKPGGTPPGTCVAPEIVLSIYWQA